MSYKLGEVLDIYNVEPEYVPKTNVSPEQALIANIIRFGIYEQDFEFINSKAFAMYSKALGWNPDYSRKLALQCAVECPEKFAQMVRPSLGV